MTPEPSEAELPESVRRAWPDMPGGAVSAGDRAVLEGQLGYLRYEPLAVLTRCPAGYPQVVLSFFAPGKPDEISTNLFWVTSPYLRVGVDRIEGRGTAREIKAWVLADPERAARFEREQQAYHALAVRLFAECLGRPVPRSTPIGVGGVRALDQVKCLHAHLACWMATGRSIVGENVAEILRTELAPDWLCSEGRCPHLRPKAA